MALASACSTSGSRDEEDVLYKMQRRLLELERKVNAPDSAKRFAKGEEKVDQLTNDLNKVRGELDALRIGVTMGEMPGTPIDRDSLAKGVAALAARIHQIEDRQAEMLELISKKAKGESKKDVHLKSLAQVQKSFEEKKYQTIVHSSDSLLAISSLKPEERGEIRYLTAESLFALNKFRDAALEFNHLLVVPGIEVHLPAIKLRLGDCFRKLGDAKAAMIFYKELLRDFPQSKEADAAREQVNQLGG
jgi:tetratricopeptide (TPR) repeat protein